MQAKRACCWPESGPPEKENPPLWSCLPIPCGMSPSYPQSVLKVPRLERNCRDVRGLAYKMTDLDAKTELRRFTAGIETVNRAVSGGGGQVATDR